MELTIVTTPKPFVGVTDIHQRNAIASWRYLGASVIMVGGPQEIADEYGLILVSDGVAFDGPVPYVNSLFAEAEKRAQTRVIAYVNADTILLSNLLPAVERADIAFTEFLMCGQRWDVHLNKLMAFNHPLSSEFLYTLIHQEGELHSPSGKDWFAWKPPLRLDIPDLVIGRAGWDNWILDRCGKVGIPVINATSVVTAIHPYHDYSHLAGGLCEAHIDGPQAVRNKELANVPTNKGRISEAQWIMTQNEITRNPA